MDFYIFAKSNQSKFFMRINRLPIISLFAVTTVFAQQNKFQQINKQTFTGNLSHAKTKKFSNNGMETINPKSNGYSYTPAKVSAFEEVILGETKYDLQTNSSVANRFIKNDDGDFTYVYTYSDDLNGYPDRGTAYVRQTDGVWSAAPEARIESSRTGWPNVVENASREVIISHNTASEKLEILKRATPGTGSWSSSLTELSNPIPQGNWWPRMVRGGADGNTIHTISITYPVVSGGVEYLGLDGALLYSRSTDGGQTWDKDMIQIPGMDTTEFYGFSGDGYAIDARGDNVVIVTGDSWDNILLWKSTDNGETWTKTVVYDLGLPRPYDIAPGISDTNADGVADTLVGSGGSLAVILDNNNKAHVFFDLIRYLDETVETEGSWTYFPFANPGIAYWNENTPDSLKVVGNLVDADGDGQFAFNANGAESVSRYGNTGIVNFPSASLSPDNILVLSYAAITEYGPDELDKSYRHTYVVTSQDGGNSWGTPTDVFSDELTECVFGILLRETDTDVHLVYMRDSEPGHGVPASDGTTEQPEGYGQFVYTKIRLADILSTGESVSEINSFIAYPNPSSDEVTLDLSAKKAGNAVLSISDIFGRTLSEKTFAQNGTDFRASFNVSELAPGFYFAKATQNGETVTRKIQVK